MPTLPTWVDIQTGIVDLANGALQSVWPYAEWILGLTAAGVLFLLFYYALVNGWGWLWEKITSIHFSKTDSQEHLLKIQGQRYGSSGNIFPKI